MKGVAEGGSAEASYYTWVDQFDTFGLGRNIPINTGNAPEGLLALKDGKCVILRVPYPLGFYTKWVDGRIDDAKAGWKGRGLRATISTRAPFHLEGGKGTTSKVMKFQLRPDPLVRSFTGRPFPFSNRGGRLNASSGPMKQLDRLS